MDCGKGLVTIINIVLHKLVNLFHVQGRVTNVDGQCRGTVAIYNNIIHNFILLLKILSMIVIFEFKDQ